MQWNTQFDWRGRTGQVAVECIANDDPEDYGTTFPDTALGFPVCTATVRYPGRGYNAMFGWVQLVCSTDNTSGGEQFEIDPFALFGDARSPYCWYGTDPTLFDAPSRPERVPLAWQCYSFLAATPIDEVMAMQPRRVVPLTGFGWGFDVRDDGSVDLRAITGLSTPAWEEVLPELRAEYPSPVWTFADGFARGDGGSTVRA